MSSALLTKHLHLQANLRRSLLQPRFQSTFSRMRSVRNERPREPFLKFYIFKTMYEDVQRDAPVRSQDHGGARRKADYIALTKAARARFDALAAESIEAVFQAVLTAATQDGDMAAAKLLMDRVIPSRRGATVSFHIRPLKTPEDCALAYADLLDDVGAGRLTPEEAQTISAIVAKRAELFASVELASGDRSSQSATRCGRWCPTRADADPPPVRDHLTEFEGASNAAIREIASTALLRLLSWEPDTTRHEIKGGEHFTSTSGEGPYRALCERAPALTRGKPRTCRPSGLTLRSRLWTGFAPGRLSLANDEHVALLRQGVWKPGTRGVGGPFPGPRTGSLIEADLRGALLNQEVHLTEVHVNTNGVTVAAAALAVWRWNLRPCDLVAATPSRGRLTSLAVPGFACRRCCSAKRPAGVTEAIAVWSLFCHPATTSPAPRIIASNPVFATSAGSSFFIVPTLVSIISARSKNSVAVAPGMSM